MLEKLELKSPEIIYEESFLENVEAFKECGEVEYYNMYRQAREDFESYVKKLNNQAKGIDLPKGYIPCTTFWLVNEQDKVIGVIRIRHQSIPLHGHIGYAIAPQYRGKGYGKKILELALPYAKEIGIDQVIINCEASNKPSKRVVLSNGGIPYQTLEEAGKSYQQYVIELA